MKEKEISFNENIIYVISHIFLILGMIIPYKGIQLNELSWVALGPLMVYLSLIQIFEYKNKKLRRDLKKNL